MKWLCHDPETAPCCPSALVRQACAEDVNGAACEVCHQVAVPEKAAGGGVAEGNVSSTAGLTAEDLLSGPSAWAHPGLPAPAMWFADAAAAGVGRRSGAAACLGGQSAGPGTARCAARP